MVGIRMRSYLIGVFIIFLTFIPLTNGQATTSIYVSANNAVLIEQSSGRILFSKKAHEKRSIASITKIMTAIIAIEQGDLDDTVTTSREAVWTEGSSIYLEEGEKILLEDLLYGLMLRSGNDAAVAISEHIAGSVEGFAYLMNEKARWIGMTNTHFDNPHGLESANHYSTAYDMALLLRYAMNNETFNKISNANSYLSSNRTYKWHNKNKLLTSYYEYCTGGKTGFTKKAGRTLATTAHKKGMDLIAVTLNAPDDWQDHIRMFEWGYDTYDLKQLNPQRLENYLITETNKFVTGYIDRELVYPLKQNEQKLLNDSVYIYSSPKQQDHPIGKKVFYIDSKQVREVPIFSSLKKQKNYSWAFLFKKIMGLKRDG